MSSGRDSRIVDKKNIVHYQMTEDEKNPLIKIIMGMPVMKGLKDIVGQIYVYRFIVVPIFLVIVGSISSFAFMLDKQTKRTKERR